MRKICEIKDPLRFSAYSIFFCVKHWLLAFYCRLMNRLMCMDLLLRTLELHGN